MSESTLTSNKSLPGLPTAKAALEGNSFPLFQFFWSPDKKSRWQMQRPFKVMSLWLWFLSQQTIFTWLSINLDEQILNYLGKNFVIFAFLKAVYESSVNNWKKAKKILHKLIILSFLQIYTSKIIIVFPELLKLINIKVKVKYF